MMTAAEMLTGAIPPHAGPAQRVGRLQAMRASPTWRLLRFLLALGVLSGLYGLYVWQASTITVIQKETVRLGEQVGRAEQENVALMLQVAAWNRPDYVESKASALGMVQSPQSAFVQAPSSGARQSADGEGGLLAVWWQELTTTILDRLKAMIPVQVTAFFQSLGQSR
jgi:hypothetical protein